MCKPRISIRPMDSDEFGRFRVTFIEDWAGDLMKAEYLSIEMARSEATRQVDLDLKDGNETKGHHLYVIENNGTQVGTLWFSLDNGRAFLDDITLVESERGKGLGRRALELMEAEVNSLGASVLVLNVAPDNHRAKALYASLGFEVTGVKMAKRILSE